MEHTVYPYHNINTHANRQKMLVSDSPQGRSIKQSATTCRSKVPAQIIYLNFAGSLSFEKETSPLILQQLLTGNKRQK